MPVPPHRLKRAARRIVERILRLSLDARHYDFFLWCVDHFGWIEAGKACGRRWWTRDALVSVPVPGSGRRAWLRPGSVDQRVFQEIFLSGVYEAPLPEARFIIDAGGHIGLAAIFFRLRYPRARIAVIEPDASNLAVLARNVGQDALTSIHEGGLWGRSGTLRIVNRGDDSWAFRVEEGEGLRAFTVDELLALHGFDRVDVLKIDIEGAEIEVLQNAEPWIGRVGAIVVELHDCFRAGCRASLDDAVRGRAVREYARGENTVVVFA